MVLHTIMKLLKRGGTQAKIMISDLIVNVSLLTSFTFIWHQLFRNCPLTHSSPLKVKLLDGLIGGVLGLILMHYSIQINEITILDLRHIPLILLAYFGGFIPAIIAAAIISVGRFFIDVNFSSIISLFMMFTMTIGAGFIAKYIKLEAWKKWTLLLFYSQLIYTIALYIVVDHFSQVLSVAIYHIVSSLIGGFFTFYFVLYIRKYTQLYNSYKESSKRDFLTGLYNVRGFDFFYNLMIEKTKKEAGNCAICIIDIDFFKKINDLYGHPAGDEVLRQLARLLKNLMREEDIVSRNGGEEFTVLLENCSLKQAEIIAFRTCETVRKHTFVLPNKKIISLTVSIGVSAYLGKDADTFGLYQEADAALYKAKQEGRNSVWTSKGKEISV